MDGDSLVDKNQDFHEVFFIYNRINTSNIKLMLNNDHKGLLGKLEQLKEQYFSIKELNETYIYSIYFFKVYPSKIKDTKKNKLEIILELKDEKENKFNSNTIIIDLKRDNFIYDIQFKEKGFIFTVNPPKSLKLGLKTQINILVEFLTKNRKLNANKLLQIILNTPNNIRIYFLQNLYELCPTSDDFLGEESEKYILFKGLLNNGIMNNNDMKQILYIEKSLFAISDLESKLKLGEIKWDKILHFYNDKEKKEKIFYDKLLTIFLNDKNQASDVKSYIDICYLYKITINDKLNLILNYFSKFFTEKEKNNISEIKNHLEQLTSGSINYYWKKQKELDNLINK